MFSGKQNQKEEGEGGRPIWNSDGGINEGERKERNRVREAMRWNLQTLANAC